MKGNLGAVDRLVRLVLAALGWWLASTIGYSTVGGVIVLVLAGVLLLTAVAGFCPAYVPFRFSTRGGSPHQVART